MTDRSQVDAMVAAVLARLGRIDVLEESLEGGLQRFEFGVAADHARRHAFDAACADAQDARLGAAHQPALDGRVHALRRQGLLRVHLEQAAHLGIGVVRDPQGPGRGGVPHVRGDVHRDAADGTVSVHPAAQHHATGVQAHAHVEPRNRS